MKMCTAFWEEVVAEVRQHLVAERFTEGCLHAIQKVGAPWPSIFRGAATIKTNSRTKIARD